MQLGNGLKKVCRALRYQQVCSLRKKVSIGKKRERVEGLDAPIYTTTRRSAATESPRKITQRQITTIRQDQTSTEFAPEQIREITDAS